MIFVPQILEFLGTEQITFEIEGDTSYFEDKPLRFASTKNKVEFGCYYLTQDYIFQSTTIKKSIVLTDASLKEISKGTNNVFVWVENPQRVHYKIAARFAEKMKNGIHSTAIVSENASVDPTAYIGPYCVLEACKIEAGVQLLNNVIVRDNVIIGARTVIEGNSVIGARGMAWIWDEDGKRVIQPQLGGVHIGSDCIFGTDITIVRGSLSENTVVGSGTIMAHGTKIGHGSIIGAFVHMANNVSLAGNAHIGTRTFLGSACVISSNVRIAANCIVGAGAVVNKSNDIAFATLVGVPAKILEKDNYLKKSKGVPKPYKN
ncbi:MAG: UDP-3-O-(3-hydroxymyristoyl) glucosamine N-acyltransferase [Flavobacteriaceae bacterium]|nr:UDP-3-O-(3-hydroxymyristoyl) glucosamine N-acyltransferase [Flavobacteriaceae bacterium]